MAYDALDIAVVKGPGFRFHGLSIIRLEVKRVDGRGLPVLVINPETVVLYNLSMPSELRLRPSLKPFVS